jgi:hypothetical protein
VINYGYSTIWLFIYVPLDPVPAVVDTIAEFYASGLFLARNNLPEGQMQHPNVVLAEKKLAEYKASLRRSYKLFSNSDGSTLLSVRVRVDSTKA